MRPVFYDIYPQNSMWYIDTYEIETDEFVDSLPCSNLKEVAQALLNVAEEDGTIDINPGFN